MGLVLGTEGEDGPWVQKTGGQGPLQTPRVLEARGKAGNQPQSQGQRQGQQKSVLISLSISARDTILRHHPLPALSVLFFSPLPFVITIDPCTAQGLGAPRSRAVKIPQAMFDYLKT